MADDILKQVEMAAYFGNLLTRVRKLEKDARNDSTAKKNDGTEGPQDGNPLLNPYVFFTCLITSIVDDTTVIGALSQPRDNTISNPTVAWAAVPGVPSIEITVPTGGSVPAVGDDVMAHFTGLYTNTGGDLVPRYGAFGGGGGGTTLTVIRSIGNDHLITRTIVGSVLGATDILVAKNWRNQRTPWDGNTINGYTYVYSTTIRRQVTITASPGFVQIEEVIPSYNVNDVIFAVETGSPILSVTVAGTPVDVTRTDLNNDNREFVRVGFAT